MPSLDSIATALVISDDRLRGPARRALGAIDRVHLADRLPRIPLDQRRDAPNQEGQYRFKANDGRVLGIGVEVNGPVPEFTLLHEIGHFLDHQALGKRGAFASPRHPVLAGWRRAVGETVACRRLNALLRLSDNELAGVLADGDVDRPRAHLRYLLRYTELWARCYAQYVASRANDRILVEQLAAERAAGDPIWDLGQWADDDFAPVQTAIGGLFRDRGWLR